MKYADIEGLGKKDEFKKGFFKLFFRTQKNLYKHRLKILSDSIGEPAALIDFSDYDFYLAFKSDGIGTKTLIADKMAKIIRSNNKYSHIKIDKLYEGLGIDLIASNVNDLICLGATPVALSDEIAAGKYEKFMDQELIRGLYKGLEKGCNEAGITIPCGESPTLPDIVTDNAINITASAIGIIKPKKRAVFEKKLKEGDIIFALSSSGIHTNGLSLARRIVEKLPGGYFTKFGNKTVGEELLTPTQIYVKPILEMLDDKVVIHYMSNISGSAFHKIMREKKDFTYVIDQLPDKPKILSYLQKIHNIPDNEAYETWNMGVGFAIFAPPQEENKIMRICKKYKINCLRIGYVKKGGKQVIIKPISVIYKA